MESIKSVCKVVGGYSSKDTSNLTPVTDFNLLKSGDWVITGGTVIEILDPDKFIELWSQASPNKPGIMWHFPKQLEVRPNLSIAKEAEEIIYGDREATYGDPSKNLRIIASLWSAYLGTEITATQVCDMMVLLKVARLKNTPHHRDSMVDIIGYTLLKERCRNE